MDLLPCPFCGANDPSLYSADASTAWIECGSCGAFGPTETGDSAGSVWNDRPKASDWLALAERLKVLIGVPSNQLEPFEGNLEASPISPWNELAPCPFCGGLHGAVRDGPVDYASCWSCRATGPPSQGMAVAAAAWNKRSSLSPEEIEVRAVVELLQKAFPPVEWISDLGEPLD